MRKKLLALLLGWLVPGLGHLYAGRRWKALVFFTVITASAFAGLAMGEFRNVYFSPGHYQFYAEVGNGLFTLGASLVMRLGDFAPIESTAHGAMLGGKLPIADLYLMLAGLLNFIIAANAFDCAGTDQEETA